MIKNTQTKLNSMSKQKGLVLFIALIALVAMSLAAAALIRSVDTTTLVAGNLAFKRSALMAGDSSIALAANYIRSNGGSAALDTNAETVGYHATANGLDYKLAATWTDANSETASGAGFTAAGEDTSGNTVRYVIERMCRDPGPATSGNCLLATAPGAKSQEICSECASPPGNTAIYRVTSRVKDPRNTVSYIQAYIY